MTAINTQTTVGQLVADRPSRARVFEELGIDYCCGGGRPLAEACAEKGLEPQRVIASLEESDRAPARAERQWTQASLTELADHIEATHHTYLKRELPRISGLVSKVVAAHAERHAELPRLQDTFEQLRAELEAHLMKEERILFPMIRQLEAVKGRSGELPEFHCGSIRNPMFVMVHEHDQAGAALAAMRELTGDYAAPADACNTYRALLDALNTLELDLHQHIHKENNVLFPRAAELEAELAGAAN